MAQFALAEQKHMAEMVEDLGAKDEDIFPVENGRRPSSVEEIGYGSDQEPEIPFERGISQILSSDDEFDHEMEQNGSGGVISKLLRKLVTKFILCSTVKYFTMKF